MKYSFSATVKAHTTFPSETPLRHPLILQLLLFFVPSPCRLQPPSELLFPPMTFAQCKLSHSHLSCFFYVTMYSTGPPFCCSVFLLHPFKTASQNLTSTVVSGHHNSDISELISYAQWVANQLWFANPSPEKGLCYIAF